ncbi:Alpha/Beta hydrolase protein [Phaeosphaeriaceae sp. PMI808]|nr:Alpha/Beta hydrolase protein [Phaeosphaeriaceae sp. PMI808]
MSFFKKLIRPTATHARTNTNAGGGNGASQNASSNAPIEELFSTVGDYGLQTLSESVSDIIDIVFVHGLTGNRESTWTDKPTNVFWPRDLLAKDLPKARIITFGYDADIIRGLSVAGNGTLRDHGKALAEDLGMRRKRTDTNFRPLIFVAHSLGGLVVEQALLVSRGSAQQHTKDLLESTVAIAFMGTPHLGANLANWGHPISKLSNLLRKTNSEIVGVLQPGSEMLAAVQQEFHTMLDDRSRNDSKFVDIFCFYEELGYTGLGEIVPKQSAILAAYPNNGIHATHTGMTRFETAKDAGYVRVQDRLWLWYNTVEENQDAWKEKKEAAKRQQQRLLQPTSPTENDHRGTLYSGFTFNAPISGRNVISGTQVTGGTTNFNLS